MPKRPRSPKKGKLTKHKADEERRENPRAPELEAPAARRRDAEDEPDRDEEDELEQNGLFREEAEEEEEEGEDLFGQDMMADYRDKPEEDRYDGEGLDETEYDAMGMDARRAADAEVAKRHRIAKAQAAAAGRRPLALLSSEGDEPSSELISEGSETIRLGEAAGSALESELPEDTGVNLDNVRGPLREWVNTEAPRREIYNRFKKFLMERTDKYGQLIYKKRIEDMCIKNKSSLEVSYIHLSKSLPTLAIFTADAPAEMLKIMDESAYAVTLELFPNYEKISNEVKVRITDLSVIDSIRDIRQTHLNCLIRVSGVVTRRTGVFPQLKAVKYDCAKCGFTIGPIVQSSESGEETRVNSCPQCESKGPFSINMEETVYRDFQKITLQESPGTVPAGRLPRSKDVILLGDLIDSARPGEEVEVTGIYKNSYDFSLNVRHGFPVFATIIEANYVGKKTDLMEAFTINEEDKQQILALAKDPRVSQRIIKSIAPSIYGHDDVRTSIALALFGGCSKDIDGKHRIRGDINVLLLGDPGTAKSQFLKYVEKTAFRGVFTTGKGSTAVGLTAAVHKDPVTREWTLEGGALVLADNGVCLIDEFDKMNDQDRTSIHEAMEQQSISISKAGIVTSLQARCSVIAAANPIKGFYDKQLTFQQNVDLTEPILSRFDCLCVIRDIPDPIADEHLADFVISNHIKSHEAFKPDPQAAPVDEKDIIPQSLLRKYLMYAKKNIRPRLTNVNQDKLMKVYADLRKENIDGFSISVRHLESMIRMAEAHARMCLRDYVRDDDVNVAIRVMVKSFISSQKKAVAEPLEKAFSKYITLETDHHDLLLYILNGLVRDEVNYVRYTQGAEEAGSLTEVLIQIEDFEVKARELDIYDVHSFVESPLFKANKFAYDAARKTIKKSFQ